MDELNINTIPDSAISFSEMADHISIFTYDEYNSLIESIGLDELDYFKKNNGLIVYEEMQLIALQEKFTDYISKIVNHLNGFWGKAINKFSHNDKRVADAFNRADLSMLKDNVSYGTTHEFKNIGKSDYASRAKILSDTAAKVYNGMIRNGAEKEEIDSATAKLESKIIPFICGVSTSNTNKELKKAIKSKALGNEITVTKKWIISNRQFIYNTLTGKSSVELAKQAYNDEKKALNSISKDINSMNDSLSNIANAWGKVISQITDVMHKCYAVEMDALSRKNSEYKYIASTVIKRTNGSKLLKEDYIDLELDDIF